MKINGFLAVALLAAATTPALGQTLYGITTTTWEEGNARIVSVEIDKLSTDPQNPTRFTEVATFEHAADFMAGTWADGKYYCYYNTYDQDIDLSLQYFGTLSMLTGEFNLIAQENHVDSDNVTDMLDMTYDPVLGGLLGLDRQYVPSKEKFISTIQNISMRRGTLSEVCAFDRRYIGICSDETDEGGYYLATNERVGEEEYRVEFYKADDRFNVTPLAVEGDLPGLSSFAHSMTINENKLYLATGSIINEVNLDDLTSTTYYVEKDMYGITFHASDSGVDEIGADPAGYPVEYFTLQGVRIAQPERGRLVIKRQGPNVSKVIYP